MGVRQEALIYFQILLLQRLLHHLQELVQVGAGVLVQVHAGTQRTQKMLKMRTGLEFLLQHLLPQVHNFGLLGIAELATAPGVLKPGTGLHGRLVLGTGHHGPQVQHKLLRVISSQLVVLGLSGNCAQKKNQKEIEMLHKR
ncbi:hypothetical protein FOE74_18965 [Rufibacter glacialis]|uniref:Uncharacterized protein n=1 Tax=Rufibacter glacialis TaxID=1259555 RepID=A0A5M8Q8B0_9BACT|nr:hypothetical protein FOE74_18965 [Rufibacter glacialis]